MRNAILVILLALLLVLSGCGEKEAPESPIEEVVEEAEEVVEEIEEAEEEVEEAEEEVEEVEEAAEEEEAEEALEEETEEEEEILESGIYDVKEGDKLELFDKSIEFTQVSRSNGLYFNVDTYRSYILQTSKHEIVQGIKFTYVTAVNYGKDTTLRVKIEKFELGENEYLLKKAVTQTVEGVQLKINAVDMEANSRKGRAYINFPNQNINQLSIRDGETKTRANLTFMMIKGYWESGNQYAIFNILPV